jgi:hypothetical protein
VRPIRANTPAGRFDRYDIYLLSLDILCRDRPTVPEHAAIALPKWATWDAKMGSRSRPNWRTDR